MLEWYSIFVFNHQFYDVFFGQCDLKEMLVAFAGAKTSNT